MCAGRARRVGGRKLTRSGAARASLTADSLGASSAPSMLRRAARLLFHPGFVRSGADAAAWRAPPRWPRTRCAPWARPSSATVAVDGDAQSKTRGGEVSTSAGGESGAGDAGLPPRARPAELAAVFTCNVCGEIEERLERGTGGAAVVARADAPPLSPSRPPRRQRVLPGRLHARRRHRDVRRVRGPPPARRPPRLVWRAGRGRRLPGVPRSVSRARRRPTGRRTGARGRAGAVGRRFGRVGGGGRGGIGWRRGAIEARAPPRPAAAMQTLLREQCPPCTPGRASLTHLPSPPPPFLAAALRTASRTAGSSASTPGSDATTEDT